MDKCLLHVCCAPCSIAVIDELKNDYDLTVYFYNPNIYPEQEYLKRKAEVVRVCNEWKIPMIDADYETQNWEECTKGLENEPEGGKRCLNCFAMRLNKAGEYAKQNNFDIFATTLTSGRNKKADVIHPLGFKIAEKFGLKFLDIDWKTEGRQEKGRKMVKDRGIYRQDYCGCRFSIENRTQNSNIIRRGGQNHNLKP
ncbi:MAG TPA: epoxyqueuosine reductase QueH [Candidatus Magasanikbacteria bacterium]|nr:epoxyqueuosine reductase QueH [Candidatus Magasanikbacteria bacterium]